MKRLIVLISTVMLVIGLRNAVAGYGCPGYTYRLPSLTEIQLRESMDTEATPIFKKRGEGRGYGTKECGSSVPPLKITKEQATELLPDWREFILQYDDKSFQYDFDQVPVECVTQNEFIYFGISFYDGEGSFGVGGIGRYNTKSKQLELKRPKELHNVSVNKLIHDGKTLWIGTVNNGEGWDGPAIGLVQFNWDKNVVTSYIDSNDGPCGFEINDMVHHSGNLWVTTDLGASKYDGTTEKWDNYILDESNADALKKVSCSSLYSNLLQSLPDTQYKDRGLCPMDSLGPYTYRNIFKHYLNRFRPTLLKELVSDE